jgi:peptidoglycan lytic transglycosylase
VPPLADRYTGRHIRTARHGVWLTKKRVLLQPSRQLLPAAAAVTVAGLLIGGAGTVIQLGAPAPAGGGANDASFDAANFPPADRTAMDDRASRGDARPANQTGTNPAKNATQPAANAVTGSCEASYYDEGQRTANGEIFNPDALTSASPALPFNTRVRVTNVANGRSVVVRINDRSPYTHGRCLDLSRAAFASIANLGTGVVDVRYEILVQDAT